jgi:membrane-associated phospholipid phosphatase
MLETQYILSVAMFPLLALMIWAGYYVFVPDNFRGSHVSSRMHELLIVTLMYILPLGFIYLLIDIQDAIANMFGMGSYLNYAEYLIMVEGNIVSYFQNITTPLLTYVNSAIYLFGFPFLLVFTFFILVYTRKFKALQEYTIAFVLVYVIAYPFFVFFPVEVTGYTLHSVDPLLYNLSPIIVEGIKLSDPGLDNCLPSLHTALSITAMLIVVFRTNFIRFKMFSIGITTSILFTILYLGIHWITDMVAGIVLALAAYFITTKYRETITKVPAGILSSIKNRVGMMDKSITVLCINCLFEITVNPSTSISVGSVQCPHCNTIQEYHPFTHLLEQQVKAKFNTKSRL